MVSRRFRINLLIVLFVSLASIIISVALVTVGFSSNSISPGLIAIASSMFGVMLAWKLGTLTRK